MTLEQYAFVAQIAGVIVVVVTLVYLAVQTKQSTDAIKANSRHILGALDLSIERQASFARATSEYQGDIAIHQPRHCYGYLTESCESGLAVSIGLVSAIDRK